MSDSLRPGGRIDWSLVISLVVLGAGVIASFIVLREAVGNLRTDHDTMRARVTMLESERMQYGRLDERLKAIERGQDKLTDKVDNIGQRLERKRQ